MKQFTILVLFLLLTSVTFSKENCQHRLQGIVIDSISHIAIEASISIEKNITYTTNEKGVFNIAQLCEGTYVLYVQSLGYRAKRIELSIPSINIEIKLSATVQNLKLFEIEEHKREEMEALNKITLKGRELFLQQAGNLGETLKHLPGVSSVNTGNSISKPVIHGMHSNRVLILNNGIRHEGQNWGSEHAPEIDQTLAKNITLIKGANAVRYGSDALAGVILVEPSRLLDIKKKSAEINSMFNTNGMGGTETAIIELIDSNNSSLKARLHGSFKKVGDISTPTYSMNNTGVNEYNYSLACGWVREKKGLEAFYSTHHSNIGIFKGAHIGNLTDLDSAFLRSVPRDEYINQFNYSIQRPKQTIAHSLLKIRTYTEFKRLGKFNFVYASQKNQRDEFDAHRQRGTLNLEDNPELRFTLSTQTFDLTWEHLVSKGFSGSAGITGLMQSNSYLGRNLIPNYNALSTGVFFIEHYKHNKFEMEVGMRYDYREMHVVKRNKNNSLYQPSFFSRIPSGTIGVIYVKNQLTLKGYLGTAFRAPAINELFINGVHHGNGIYEIGNEKLKAEKAYNSSFNIIYIDKKISIQTEFYVNIINDYIYLKAIKPAILTVLGAFPTFTYDQCNALLTGNDLQVNLQIHQNYKVEFRSSILYARNLTNKKWIEFMPANKYEITSSINLFKCQTDITTSYVSKQSRVTPGLDYAVPPQAYALLSMQVSRGFKSKFFTYMIALGVNNLLNTSYRDYLNSYRYYSNDVGRNINIKIKINI